MILVVIQERLVACTMMVTVDVKSGQILDFFFQQYFIMEIYICFKSRANRVC